LGAKERYRDPDAVVNAWEALERVLQQAGYPGPLQKVNYHALKGVASCFIPPLLR